MLRVEGTAIHHARALRSGAPILSPPTGYLHGERQYTVEDFAGHSWTFSQIIAGVDPRGWGGEPATCSALA